MKIIKQQERIQLWDVIETEGPLQMYASAFEGGFASQYLLDSSNTAHSNSFLRVLEPSPVSLLIWRISLRNPPMRESCKACRDSSAFFSSQLSSGKISVVTSTSCRKVVLRMLRRWWAICPLEKEYFERLQHAKIA